MIPSRIRLGAASIVALVLFAQAPALGQTRTYAKEDPSPAVVFGEIVVEARRLSLEEILRLCIDAEKDKYAGVEDVTFTTTEKVVVHYGKADEDEHRTEIYEEVSRVYRKRPDLSREVSLGHREIGTKDGAENDREGNGDERDEGGRTIAIGVGSGTDAFTDLPFFFEDLSDYRFRIIDREDLETRVLYHLAFEPRSDFLARPSGEFWIDTTDFQIFHATLRWTENLPVPVLLKGLDYVAIEKKRVGPLWVYDRVSGRVKLRKIPLVELPSEVEFCVTFSDYALNQGLSAELFIESAE